MKPERFERELRYQTMLSICRSLLKAGILSQADFDDAERRLRAKYQPIQGVFKLHTPMNTPLNTPTVKSLLVSFYECRHTIPTSF